MVAQKTALARIQRILFAVGAAALTLSMLFLTLLVRAPNSSIGVWRVPSSEFDDASVIDPFSMSGLPDISKLTGVERIETEEDLLEVGRWIRSRMVLSTMLDPLPADPVRAIEVASKEQVRGFCSHYSLLTVAAAHAYGVPARVVSVNDHITSEVLWEGRWRLLDTYFNVLGPASVYNLMQARNFDELRRIDEDSSDDILWDEDAMREAFRFEEGFPLTAVSAAGTYLDHRPRSAARRFLDAIYFAPIRKYTLDSVSPLHPQFISGVWRRLFQACLIIGLITVLGSLATIAVQRKLRANAAR